MKKSPGFHVFLSRWCPLRRLTTTACAVVPSRDCLPFHTNPHSHPPRPGRRLCIVAHLSFLPAQVAAGWWWERSAGPTRWRSLWQSAGGSGRPSLLTGRHVLTCLSLVTCRLSSNAQHNAQHMHGILTTRPDRVSFLLTVTRGNRRDDIAFCTCVVLYECLIE